MSSIKSAVVVLCVCSVCYSVMLMLVNDSAYKRILRSIFGMAIIIIIFSSFSNIKLEFDYSTVAAESQSVDMTEYADDLTLKLAALNLEGEAAAVLKNHSIIYDRIEITMDIDEGGSIVIDRAEIYLSKENTALSGRAIRILKEELGIDFTVKEV